jgi:hypothetical protein
VGHRGSSHPHRALGVGLLGLGLGLAGCAAERGPAAEGPPLLFVRQRGVWAPEDLNRDVAECIDLAHPELLVEVRLQEGPPGSARAALREQIVACMDERGWSTGSSTEPEEWAQ